MFDVWNSKIDGLYGSEESGVSCGSLKMPFSDVCRCAISRIHVFDIIAGPRNTKTHHRSTYCSHDSFRSYGYIGPFEHETHDLNHLAPLCLSVCQKYSKVIKKRHFQTCPNLPHFFQTYVGRYPRLLYTKQNLIHRTINTRNISLIRQPMPEIQGGSKLRWSSGHPVGDSRATSGRKDFRTVRISGLSGSDPRAASWPGCRPRAGS